MFSTKYDRERALAEHLLAALDLAERAELSDPHAGGTQETGVDVVVTIDGLRIGVQVTEVDTGAVQGEARGEEKRLARVAGAGKPYFSWGQNDPAKMIAGLKRSVQVKALRTPAGFDEAWLLICAGVPEHGAAVSTLLSTPWITPEALTTATASILAGAAYTRAFVLSVLGVEWALYTWTKDSNGWVVERGERLGPSFDDVRSWLSNPELLADPDAWAEREAQRILHEMRGAMNPSAGK